MLDLEIEKFDKSIRINIIEKFLPSSVFPIKSLEDIYNKTLKILKGISITKADSVDGEYKVVNGEINYVYIHNKFNKNENVITVSVSGANAGYVNFLNEKIFA